MNKFFDDDDEEKPIKEEIIEPVKPPKQIKKLQSKRNKKNYVNNIDMYNSMLDWLQALEDDPKAPLPEYIGKCLMKMVESLGRKTHAHTHLDDMKSHALLTCCLYAKNFNPAKSTNPFSYFTTCINNAFAQVHNREKEEIEGKFQMIKDLTEADENYDYRERDKEHDEWNS